jgi:predicted ester cyclase
MLGEGPLLATHYTVTVIHTGCYFGVAPTNKKVTFFGTAIAEFDGQGLLVKEWELWDEIQLLRQLELLSTNAANLIAPFNQPEKIPEIKYTPSPLLPIDVLLHKQDVQLAEVRQAVVAENIAQWELFLAIKYKSREFSKLDTVMAPTYRWHGSCGFGWDMSDPATRQAILDGFSEQTEGIDDYQFTYRLFGEGQYVAYHIVCEYTQTAELISIEATGRKVRHSNISVCRFDQKGRIAEEWETIDILALYKQLGVIPDKKKITSIAQFIVGDHE